MTNFTDGVPASVKPKMALTQHGRAGLEALGSVQKFASGRLRTIAREAFAGDSEARRLAADHEADQAANASTVAERIAQGRAIADGYAAFRFERFSQRFVALDIYLRGLPATEERRATFAEYVEVPAERAGGSLELDPEFQRPAYFFTEWHLRPGGWDGYDLYSPMFSFGVAPHVLRHGGYAAVNVGEDISQNRRDAFSRLPKKSYGRIYEPGCGTGTTLAALHQVFPDAELVGSDLSPSVLRGCHHLAERRGFAVTLKQHDAVHCGEPSESFDAVVTYALHHELPPEENRRLFAEMFRILKPGGDIMIVDPPPFKQIPLFNAVLLDWDTANRGEPFFSASCLSDWAGDLQRAGFGAVQSFAVGDNGFPWVICATKPDGDTAKVH